VLSKNRRKEKSLIVEEVRVVFFGFLWFVRKFNLKRRKCMSEDNSKEVAVEAPVTAFSAGWEERVGKFAGNVGKPIEAISEALAEVVGVPGDEALSILADETASPFEDIQLALAPLNIPKGVLRKNLPLLRGPQVEKSETVREVGPSFDVLPSVPDDSSFLEMLKVGGMLKVGTTEIISGIKASLADRLELFNLPDTLLRKMEEFSESQAEPCGENYFALHKLVTQRSYAEILNALGISGQFMSEKKKKNLLTRLAQIWPALLSFHRQLQSWQEAWSQGMANPGVLLAAMAMGQSGSNMLPPGMMSPPETNVLRDAAEAVIDEINKCFAGTGIPVARALAYDVSRIKTILEEPSLPAAIGAANREQMIKTLGIGVSADYVRLERNVSRYALSVVEFPKIASGNAEYAYLAALLQLGACIPWDNLTNVADISDTRVRGRRTF
jgi:hypothetical protein